MSSSIVDRLTRTLLFEGYALYPYRADSVKNQQRWSFGTLYPRAWCESEGSDAWAMQTEILVRGALSMADVRIRFLHLRERVGDNSDGVTGEAARWQEAKEHEIALPLCSVAELVDNPRTHRIDIAGAVERDSQRDITKMITRRAEPLTGVVELSAELVGGAIARLRVRVRNETPVGPELFDATDLRERRRLATRSSFASAHTLIGIADGALVSLLDPPPELAEAAAACRNEGTWPVLVGEVGDTDMMLSSPIILYDYPAVAPESSGELYDSTEIDEILTLRVLTLSDEEKVKIRELDPRARAILERCERLDPDELARMHGAIRRLDRGGRDPRSGLGPGDRVRVCPSAPSATTRNDAMDVVLAGKLATVVCVEQDLEGRVMVAVAIDDDPGRDLGVAGKIGHRFFFRPDELAPIGVSERRT